MLKVLELFSGTGSIGKVCKEVGYSSLSLDLELEADININIMDWDYKKLQHTKQLREIVRNKIN